MLRTKIGAEHADPTLLMQDDISSLESQIKSLLERSTGTVAKLDGQISKLDEHLSKSSATKRRKARTPAPPHVLAPAAKGAGTQHSHPFNKWLVCVAGSDSSRAAESNLLTSNRPLTLDEISFSSPAARSRKLPQRVSSLSARRDGPATVRNDDATGTRAFKLASSPGNRMADYSFHAPSAVSSQSPWLEPRTRVHSTAGHRSPNGSKQGRDGLKVQSEQPSPFCAVEFARDRQMTPATDEDLAMKLEARMEAKLRSMFESVSNEINDHSASKRDLEMLQEQVTRLREEVVTAKSDVAVALKECRAARVAFASEHWSVKKIFEQLESLRKKHQQEVLELEQRVLTAAKEAVSCGDTKRVHGTTPTGYGSASSEMREAVTRLEVAVAALQREVSETSEATSQSEASSAALKALVEELFEKCDAVQHATIAGAESLEKKILERCHEADEAIARISKDMRKTSAKVL